jgi:hypothetical protein
VDYAGYRFLFGKTHDPDAGFFTHGYKSHFDAPVGKFGDVVIPIKNFTDNWDDATGKPVKTCAENEKYCPNAKTLKDLQTMAFWGEGVEGKVHLEVRSVKATGCPSARVTAPAAAVPLVTFDGAAGTTHVFNEVNDPVMGGKSTGTWAVNTTGGFGVFDGEVVDVPSLQAPGFIKAVGDGGKYADASAAIGGALVLSVRTTTPGYKGFRVTFASGTLSVGFACAGGGSLPGSRGCFKAKFAVPAGDDFTRVRIPFSSFSDEWSSATGEPTKTCADDKSVCPTAKKLGKIQDVEIWAEGALGKVHVEVESVSAEA